MKKLTLTLAALCMLAALALPALAGRRMADRLSATLPAATGVAEFAEPTYAYTSAELRRATIVGASQAIITAKVYRVMTVPTGVYTQEVASVTTSSNVGTAAPAVHTPILQGDKLRVAIDSHGAGTNAVVILDLDILR